MKTNLYFKTLLVSALFVLAACGAKKSEDHDGHHQVSDSHSWKEMDDFHMVMAETFHPYKDSADLAPTKAKAGELVAAADKWVNAPAPEKVDNDEMKTKLRVLKGECEVLADLVQTGEDDQIGGQLTKVHDLFHEIQENWYAGDGHEHHHEH